MYRPETPWCQGCPTARRCALQVEIDSATAELAALTDQMRTLAASVDALPRLRDKLGPSAADTLSKLLER